MKNITTKNKWFIGLSLAGQTHGVLFDGSNVYDDVFPDEKIVRIPTPCGIVLSQEKIVEICKNKMKSMRVVPSIFNGEYVAEHIETPREASCAIESYWDAQPV